MSFSSETTMAGGKRGSRIFARILRRLCASIETGSITIVLPSGRQFEHRGVKPGPQAKLQIRRWRAISRLFVGGDVGFAEGYIAKDWESPDVTALLELAARNSRVEHKFLGSAPFRVFSRLCHLARSNSRTGSKRNIAFHYDIGNEFYRCWLDESMTYSAALYDRPDQTLEMAQKTKIERVARLLDLTGTESILEIGCGWGALAASLAPRCQNLTGVTLSSEQLAYARQTIERSALTDKVHLKLMDYRDLEGDHDRIVSIEMLEAVGESYWPRYFQTVRDRLKPGGKAVLQVITIEEGRFEHYRRSADFIQRYIFPGGMLPTREIIAEQAANAGLTLSSVELFGESYALTLAEWRRRFQASWPKIAASGFPERFRRLWTYYLCYCEAGFRAGAIDVGLYVFSRADAA